MAAILMLAGIFYGSQYGDAIGAILLNRRAGTGPPRAAEAVDLTFRRARMTALYPVPAFQF